MVMINENKELTKKKLKRPTNLFIQFNVGENGMHTPRFTEHTINQIIPSVKRTNGANRSIFQVQEFVREEIFPK